MRKKLRAPSFVALDFETATQSRNSACQIGLVRFEEGREVASLCELIQPPDNRYYQKFTDEIHGIGPQTTRGAPTFAELWPTLKPWFENQLVVAHNATFDLGVLASTLEYYGIPPVEFQQACTYRLWGVNLKAACLEAGVSLDHHHDALCDSRACGLLYLKAMRLGLK